MRKYFIVILFFLNIQNSFSNVGWFTQYVHEGRSFYDICMVNANTGYVCGSNGLILKTSNGGNNWSVQYVPTSANTNIISINFIDALTGWAVTGINNYAIINTTNGGITWLEQNVGQVSNSRPGFIYPVNNTNVFLGFVSDGTNFSSAGQLWKSINSGATYGTSLNLNGADMKAINFINSNTGWVISYQWNDFQRIASISKTTNGGDNWIVQTTDSLKVYSQIKFFNSQTGIAFAGLGSFKYFMKTTNGGENWSSVQHQIAFNNFDFVNESYGWCTVFSTGDTSSILRTTNGGVNWLGTRTDVTFFLVPSKIKFINETTGWVIGSSMGGIILKTTTGGVTFVNNTSSEIPNNFSLSQNYPNPFNPSTVINYQLAINSFVSVKIYDVLGNEVQTLVNEKQNAGSYSVDFNAGSLPSGIYFYKLVTEKFSETKKMILIK